MHHAGRAPGLLLLEQIQTRPLMRHRYSDYMHWSKTQGRARFNLATSGVAAFPLQELPVDLEELEINGENSYGYEPLQAAIAKHHSVDPECVVEAAGTSMANHLAMAAVIESGDEVLIEHPAYGPILDVAQYLQANVKRFRRAEENGWAIDPADVRHCVTPKTRLIVISSLTKVYGVSGLRCGWILAQPDLAWKMRRLNDLYSATPVFPGELLSVAAFKHLNLLRERARRIVEADRNLLWDFLAEQSAISAVRTDWGTTSFVRLPNKDADVFLERLRSEFDTSAVPGRFFEMPDHFRIGMGVNTEMFAEGLNQISRALR